MWGKKRKKKKKKKWFDIVGVSVVVHHTTLGYGSSPGQYQFLEGRGRAITGVSQDDVEDVYVNLCQRC